MPNCSPSFTHETLAVSGNCATQCRGVAFVVDFVNCSTDADGGCIFEWKVTRTKNGVATAFSGEEKLDCPDSMDLIFYCSAAKVCKRFKLTLTCLDN